MIDNSTGKKNEERGTKGEGGKAKGLTDSATAAAAAAAAVVLA